jgi:hypothetical protein
VNLLRMSTTVLASLALTSMGLVVASPVGAAPPVPGDQLTVQEAAGSTDITYGHSRTFIAASATTEVASRRNATIDVNGKTFTLKVDKKTNTVTWGGGGRTLDPADAGALKSMAEGLHRQYLTRGKVSALAPDTELLIRFTMLLAEAPAGVKLKDYVVDAPVITELPASEVLATEPAVAEGKCSAGKGTAAAAGEMAIAAACQRGDEDGIQYMACTRANRSLSHDSAGHCFLTESINSGPGSSGSLGECGSGVTGIGTYTYDCGDHDRCGRAHGGSFNPWDSECGDEYFEADDDFLFAPIGRC